MDWFQPTNFNGVKMSKLKSYTLELYKTDRRGQRLVEKMDFAPVTRAYIDTVVGRLQTKSIIVKLIESPLHL